MSNDGKRLEALVAYVERTLVPEGFTVTSNERVLDDEGVQIAEFDVLIQGKVGTGEFRWLIECRDRPSSGRAPASWVEQLIGRRDRFNLSKVTAVSTTGFAPGVHALATAHGIELREVGELAPEHFREWMQVEYVNHRERRAHLQGSRLLLRPDVANKFGEVLQRSLPSINGDTPILRAPTGEVVTLARAFGAVVEADQEIWDDVEPNGPGKQVHQLAEYLDEDHFVIDTPSGTVPIAAIEFIGELSVRETRSFLARADEYRNLGSNEVISQVVTFAPQTVMGQRFCIELHKLGSNGETRVTLRRLPHKE